MDDLARRLALAGRAVASLRELVGKDRPSPVERDAAIQRFEYSVEAVWKAARGALLIGHGVEANSPKSVVRACAQNALLDEVIARAAMEMIDDRNLTVHTYNEALANEIYARLAKHCSVLESWLDVLHSTA